MNINPLYLQEVSKEYYIKILNNSPQHKLATRLTKRWLKKNPSATRDDVLEKYSDFSSKVHYMYDKPKKRQLVNTLSRNCFIHGIINMEKENEPKDFPGHSKDIKFKCFKRDTNAMRNYRLKELERSRKKNHG